MERLRDAWLGWQYYMEHGKLAALFLLALLYLFLIRGKRSAETGRIGSYGLVTAALCIFPPTAALLMCYQTRFYNYEWIWSLVPVTVTVALGGTLLLTEQWKSWKNNICYNIALTAMVAGIILLSGRIGGDIRNHRPEPQERVCAEQALAAVTDPDAGEEICLWAPGSVLEYARALDGGLRLLYGRNMWDVSLNAYSYDKYPAEMEKLYLWMEETAETGEWVHEIKLAKEVGAEEGEDEQSVREILDGNEQITHAIECGANRILLRDNLSEDSLRELKAAAEAGHLEIEQTSGYYLLKKR